uniref:Uncharacterized protein n=1 Tax=Solanum tuberosum TaxID=4113 RepID=M1D255_SOLTU
MFKIPLKHILIRILAYKYISNSQPKAPLNIGNFHLSQRPEHLQEHAQKVLVALLRNTFIRVLVLAKVVHPCSF